LFRAAPRYNLDMTITVLLFASVAEKAGKRRLELPFAAGDSVASVRDRLLEGMPQLRPFVPNLMYALDEEYVRETAAVRDGATLALIPPVSGG
jgi:molybdopterin synthase catalytic subunit